MRPRRERFPLLVLLGKSAAQATPCLRLNACHSHFLLIVLRSIPPGLGRFLALLSPRPEAQRRPFHEETFQTHNVAAGLRNRRVGRLPGVLSRKRRALCTHRRKHQLALLAGSRRGPARRCQGNGARRKSRYGWPGLLFPEGRSRRLSKGRLL